jgi:hypothetical protein
MGIPGDETGQMICMEHLPVMNEIRFSPRAAGGLSV